MSYQLLSMLPFLLSHGQFCKKVHSGVNRTVPVQAIIMASAGSIAIVLLNVGTDCPDGDIDGKFCASLLDKIRNSISCCSARSFLSASESSEGESALWNCVSDKILRYVKAEDRYLSLASFLLKSRAFHETHSGKSPEKLPLVDLPRTIHKKPFIPCQPPLISEDETNEHPLSISHQYPFAGMVRLVPTRSETKKSSKLWAGFDIVVFDPINPRMYNTVQEFVNVFSSSFSHSEFAAISDRQRYPDETNQLRELYLRWSIKEAYTKALGVGLGFDFSSFETSMDCLDDRASLWSWLASSIIDGDRMPLRTIGTIRKKAETADGNDAELTRPLQEKWILVFQPLYDRNAVEETDVNSMRGCGCVCVGPIAGAGDADDAYSHFLSPDDGTQIEWTNLAELVAWHSQ